MKYCVITKAQRTPEPPHNIVKDNELGGRRAHSNIVSLVGLLSAQMEVHIMGFVSDSYQLKWS